MLKLVIAVAFLGAALAQSKFRCAYLEKLDCEKFGNKPVCANNDVTYNNTCVMDKAACEEKTRLTVVFRGPCEDRPTLPPLLNKCSDEFKAKFVKCGETSKQLCGSDGKTYKNKCAFHEARCADVAQFGKEAPKVYVKYQGKSCEDAPKPFNACTDFWAKKDCSTERTNAFTKVCDREQNVYANRCFFAQAACKDDTLRQAFCRRVRPTKPEGSGEEPQF